MLFSELLTEKKMFPLKIGNRVCRSKAPTSRCFVFSMLFCSKPILRERVVKQMLGPMQINKATKKFEKNLIRKFFWILTMLLQSVRKILFRSLEIIFVSRPVGWVAWETLCVGSLPRPVDLVKNWKNSIRKWETQRKVRNCPETRSLP